MDEYRLRVKIGNNEFEAQGDKETVNDQFAAFKELVSMAAQTPPVGVSYDPQAMLAGVVTPSAPIITTPPYTANSVDGALDKIMKLDKRIVSLTVRPQSADDAVLLVLYGQKVMRGSDAVTGFEVSQGLQISGQGVARPDRILDKAASNNLVIVVGQHRSRTYRLTNAGIARARELAGAMIANVA